MTSQELELLTQAVDGELSSAESGRLRRLLKSSDEARALFQQLEADRDRLRQLAPVPVPERLFHDIMACVGPRPALAMPRRSYIQQPWVPLATAASLFLAVGSITLLYALQAKHPESARQPMATTQPTNPLVEVARNDLPPESGPVVAKLPEEIERPTPPAPRVVSTPPVRPAPEVVAQPRVVPPSDFLTSPLQEPSAPFETVQVRLPFLASLAEIKDRSDTLLRELHRDPAYRLDLFTKSPNHGLEMFLTAAKASGINVHVDAALQARFKKPTPASYVIYMESLTPSEIRDLLTKLAAIDGRQPKREFEMLHLAPAQTSDNRELKELLGLDLGLWKRTDAAPASRPITASTGDAVAKAVASGTVTRGLEKSAVALTLAPAALRTKPSASKELQQYLSRRTARTTGSVALMLVVRSH